MNTTDKLFSALVTIATALTGIALVAVLVGTNSKTSTVIQAATSGFAADLNAATAPVTGNNLSSAATTGFLMS